MSGILAAAQSSGCCCRPQEGCTCSNPNRPGAIIDQGLTSVLVTSGFGIDEASRANYSPFSCLECPCSGTALYGPYAYQAMGSIIDRDYGEAPCEGRGCTNGPCPSAPAYSCSAEVGSVVAHREQSFPFPTWRSRITFEGENKVGQWTWAPQRLPWCPAYNSPQVRVRRFFPFIYSNTEGAGDVISDRAGAFINVNTGEYASTLYGDTIGRIIAVAEASVLGVGSGGFADPCSYYARVAIGYINEWSVRQLLATTGEANPFGGYSALYRKPCQSPTDTVLGTYQLVYDPQYDKYEQDQSCGAIAGFHEIRQTLPQTLTIS